MLPFIYRTGILFVSKSCFVIKHSNQTRDILQVTFLLLSNEEVCSNVFPFWQTNKYFWCIFNLQIKNSCSWNIHRFCFTGKKPAGKVSSWFHVWKNPKIFVHFDHFHSCPLIHVLAWHRTYLDSLSSQATVTSYRHDQVTNWSLMENQEGLLAFVQIIDCLFLSIFAHLQLRWHSQWNSISSDLRPKPINYSSLDPCLVQKDPLHKITTSGCWRIKMK